jgi:SAM-dependent methyltransferase
MTQDLREEVRARYADAALSVLNQDAAGCCEGSSCCGSTEASFGSGLYETLQLEELPSAAVMASLGCGNPTAVAEIKEGETVLDLGSGGGIDVLLSAKRAGPKGKAYGVDMTDEMLELARRNAATAGAANVEFLKGHIEDVPLPAGSVDVIISNCVINLSTDKPAVFKEMKRLLKPGGRIGVSDIVAADALSPEERTQRGSYVGCIAGALSIQEYRQGLESAGLVGIEIIPTSEVTDQMFSAIVKATAP